MEGTLLVVGVVGLVVAFGLLGGVAQIMERKKGKGAGQIVSGLLLAGVGIFNVVLSHVAHCEGPAPAYAMSWGFIAMGAASVESGRLRLRVSKLEKEIQDLRAKRGKRDTIG